MNYGAGRAQDHRRAGGSLLDSPNMAEERLIRKYANRRLYDAHDSRHVTLDDLRKLIASGQRIKVLEDKSGEDITRSILLQIIASQEQFGTPVLSTQLLEAIVRFYGNPIQQMLTSYLEQSIGTLLRQQSVLQAEMAKALETPMAPIAEMARQNMEMWAKMQASMLSAFSPQSGAGDKAERPEKTEKPPRPESGRRRS
jgi:polyhydroxyalkanoate synthesis repressor PhaR